MWWRKRRERDLDRELRAHLDLEAEERGDVYAARRALGNAALLKEEVREAWGWMWLERLWQDVRYAARMLRKSPGFTAVAVLSLALGIGANTALFSLVDALMWKSLPVHEPKQLRVFAWVRGHDDFSNATMHNHSGFTSNDRAGSSVSGSFSYPAYRMFRDRLPQFSDVVAYANAQFTVAAQGTTDFANGQFVSGNYFSGLGVASIAGRAIVPDDDAPGKPPVAVLSYRYWEKRFGLDPSLVGNEISINRTRVTVIGVMPPVFQGLYPGQEVELFVPMAMVALGEPRYFSLTDPYTWWVQVFGRLQPGMNESAATSATRAVFASAIHSYAEPAAPIPELRLEPGERGRGTLSYYGSMAQRIEVLYAITAMVLLIACANLAHLLLARSAARRSEMAVRLSIGAGRARLIRQLLTETLVLAGAGGALGLMIAKPFLGLLARNILGSNPKTLDVRVDSHALGFTVAVSALTAVLSGLWPAWRSTRVDLAPSFKGGVTASGATSGRYTSRILIAGQVALSALLLAGAGLFVRTLVGLMEVDLGFNSSNLLTFQTDGSRSGYSDQRLADLYERVRERLESIPGVTSAALSENGLIQGWVSNGDFTMPGRTPPPGQRFRMFWLNCSDSFLPTMGIPLVLGRGLAPSDRPGAPPVAVVNESFVKLYLPGENPLGQTITINFMGSMEIVGVVKDAHYENLFNLHPTAYFPYSQHLEGLSRVTFAIRTALPPLSLAQSVRRAVSEIDANIPVAEMRTMQEQIEQSVGSEQLMAELVSAFGLAAALLAAIGLYGVMAYAVARRTAEIGIRMALGANGASVAWLVVRESVWMVTVGLAIGVPAALALSRFVRSMLYRVAPNDPWSFAGAVALMAAVGAAAAWIPARRASKVDPMAALRSE